MSKHDDVKRLKEHLAKNTTEPFVLRQDDLDYCACYILLGGYSGTIKKALRYICCKLAELCIIGAPKNFFYRLAGVKIGRNVTIATGVVLDYLCCDLIEIGDGCVLGMGCMIVAHEFTHVESRIGRVKLGKDVTIGARTVVRSGVSIGDNAIVGAMSLVVRDVEAGSTVIGVPARIVKRQ